MIRTLLLSILIIQALGAAKAPSPYCSTQQTIRQVPLSLGQQMSHTLKHQFYGYNLNISVISNSSSFARLTKTMDLIDRRSAYLPNIVSHFVEHKGNNWGKESYVLYRDMTGTYVFNYGVMVDQVHVPPPDWTVIVTTDKTVTCYGAALLLDYGLAIIDCAKPAKQSQQLQNYFFYIDLTTHNVTKQVKNSMYVKYTSITKRKLMKFKDDHTGYEYLLRVYPADGVNHEQRHNTYMQIFSIRDPYDIQIMKVIDRTYCHVKTLSIIDAKVYLGDIFFLDYFNGLYRLDILHNSDVLITGRYIKDGFTKFAVYSDDLEDQVLIALANRHAVYEIDWSNIRDPVMITKYSLMENSTVKQLIINDLFVVVQSAANATNQTNPNFQVDYTWIFSRGSRTYSNAFAVINHNSSKVELEFNRANDRLLTFDQEGISLYQLNMPVLTIALGEQGKIGTSQDVVLMATSKDPISQKTMQCQFKFKVNFVRSDNMTIYNETIDTLLNYTANNPGQTHINLDHYVLGPNITYDLININKTDQDKNATWWINKINHTRINLDFGVGDIIFFHTQVVPQYGQERLIYYIQDSRYFTHVIECVHIWDTNQVICHQQAKYAHQSAISSFTTAWFKDQQGYNYFYIVVFKQDLKTIRIFDYSRHKILMNITYTGHHESEVTGLATSNGYLYVLRGLVKTIDVYRLKDCQEEQHCKPDFYLDASTLRSKGVNYFAPEQLVTDAEHPEVLFIRCRGSVIILDIDNKENIILLDEIVATSTLNTFYRISVNKHRLVIVSDPDIIEQYTLQHIYIKNEVKFLKRLPTYGYKIPSVVDVEYSDYDNVMYVHAIDPSRNISIILVYRTSMPAATSLYTTIPLRRVYSRPGLQIEVSGFYVDFLNIKTDDGFRLYRVFGQPWLVIKDVSKNMKFSINFHNPQSSLQSEQHNITAMIYEQGFTATAELNKTINNLKLDSQGNYTWSDRKWFIGSILGYNFSCPQCGTGPDAKVRVREHVETSKTLHITGYDYQETLNGGVAVYEDLIRFRINGTVHDIIHLPDQKFLQRCIRVASAFHSQLLVTACQQLGRGINLYVTTLTTSKPWTWGPYRSSAYNARKLQIAGDILMLTDTSVYPEYKFEKGAIYLYELALDSVTGEQMDQLEVIDQNDLGMAQGFTKRDVYIGNSHLVFSSINDVYRLYVTQVDSGLFVVDFTHHIFRREINVVTINFVDLKALLVKTGFSMPTQASFQAVTLISYKYNPHFYMQTVLVTTKGFHNFQILLVYDDNGNVISKAIDKVFYRYGYYNTINQVRASHGYVAISYIIPYVYEYQTKNTRQIVAIYDTDDYQGQHHEGYAQRYLIGAFRHNKTVPLMFAFNTTYDVHSNGTRTGLVVTNPYDAPNKNMFEVSLSKNLTISVKKDFKDQTITIIPWSDFGNKSFEIRLINNGGDGANSVVIMIIIIVLSVLITVGFGCYICFLLRGKKAERNEQRNSLLTEQQTVRHSVEPTSTDYVPPALQKQQQQQSDQQEEQQQQPAPQPQPTVQKINQTIVEAPPAPPAPAPAPVVVIAPKAEQVLVVPPLAEEKVVPVPVVAQQEIIQPAVAEGGKEQN